MPKLTYENIVDPSSLDGGDSDSEDGFNVKQGKKTRGRVKIKMEFIENKPSTSLILWICHKRI
jgi:hypothetical protein